MSRCRSPGTRESPGRRRPTSSVPCLATTTELEPPRLPGPATSTARSHRNRHRTRSRDVTDSVSESEHPAIPSPTPKATRPRTNKDWWPNQLDLSVLHQHSPLSSPLDPEFDYREQFKTLDLDSLK